MRNFPFHNTIHDYTHLFRNPIGLVFNKFKYFTDTGRKWNLSNYSIKDNPNGDLIKIASTNELISVLKRKEISNFYILTHPSRWNDNLLMWTKEIVFQSAKNILKRQLKNIENTRRYHAIKKSD